MEAHRLPAATFRGTIPYGVGHYVTGGLNPGTTRPRRRRHGDGWACTVTGSPPSKAVYGKLLDYRDGPDGFTVTLDLGGGDAREIVRQIRAGMPYWIEPGYSARGELLAVYVSGTETWATAQLAPAVVSPIGPRPAVNLSPITAPATAPPIPPRPPVNLAPIAPPGVR